MQARARIRFALIIASLGACAMMTACSFLTSFDGLTDGGVRDASTDVAIDTGTDAALLDRDACTPGVASCGNDDGGVKPNALYDCDETHTETKVEDCQYGCVTQHSGKDAGKTTDLCSPCFIGGKYCGGDKIGTDPKTLYVCNPDGTASVMTNCVLGCKVNATTDDACE